MAIHVHCTCGQIQAYPTARAGQTVYCVHCGRSVALPTRGVLRQQRDQSQPAASLDPPIHPQISRRSFQMAALVLLGLLAGTGIGFWWARSTPSPAEKESPPPVAISTPSPSQPETVQNPSLSSPSIEETRQKPIETVEVRTRPVPVEAATLTQLPSLPPVDPETQTRRPPEAMPITTRDPKKTPVIPIGMPVLDKPPGGVREPLKPPREGVRLLWKLKKGDVFFQDLTVTQMPMFQIEGLPVNLALQYRIISRFTIVEAREEGGYTVEQKVEKAQLIKADDLSQSTVAEGIRNMVGMTLSIQLSPEMEVLTLDGAEQAGKGKAIPLADGKGLQMVSLLDRDGWKELAQATFFQKDLLKGKNARWTKPLTHQWGSLGSWVGQVQYNDLGSQGNLRKIAYVYQLVYKVPPAGARIGLLAVKEAQFHPPEGTGQVLFDPNRGRVAAAEEKFRVRGVVQATLLGQATRIEIEENQLFQIRISDRMPPN